MKTSVELRKMMAQIFGVPESEITTEASVDTVPNWDSLHHMRLVLALEETFGVSFTDDQTVQIMSYPLIIEVLKEHGIRLE